MRHHQIILRKNVAKKKEKKRRVTLELMKREYYKGEENWVQMTELHGPVKLMDEKMRDVQSRKIRRTANLNIIFWHCDRSKIQVLMGEVVNKYWERV